MEATLIYAIVVGGCLAALGLRQCFVWVSRNHWPSVSTFIFKYLMYPYILRRMRLIGPVFIGPVSPMQVILQMAYCIGTAICNILGVENLNQASSRAGTMAILNLISLTLGDRLSFTASMLGVPTRVACRVHHAVGWMATVQALIHVLLSIKRHPFDLREIKLRFGLVTGVCLLALLLFSLPFIRRASHEVFLKSHYTFGIVALFGLWRHLGPQLTAARAFLITSVAVLASTKTFRWLGILYRNVVAGKPWPRGKFFPTGRTNGVELRVRVARHWTPKNNQWLYVCLPPWSFAESHPYCVAWWENDKDGKLDTVSLLIKPYQGFSSHAQRVSRNADWTAVALDGPYGSPIDTSAFGTIVIFATGIGIAAELPLIKQALEERASDSTPLRRILLVWLIEESSEMDWVKLWMQRILDMDLQFTRERYGYQQLENVMEDTKRHANPIIKATNDAGSTGFCPGDVPHSELENWEEDKLIFRGEVYALHSQGTDATLGRRTTLFKGKLPDIAAVFMREYKARFGKMLVTVCAEPGTRGRVRRAATKVVGPDMQYQEMDFQPMQEGHLWQLKRAGAEALGTDVVDQTGIEMGYMRHSITKSTRTEV